MKLSKEFIAMFREEAKRARWEINSWNGKGIDDLVVDYLERKELKHEDFTGAVVLTVEESKRISMFFGAVDCCSSDIKLTEGEKNLWKNLNERIEQSEIKHLKREIAQLKKEQVRDNLEIERLEESYKNSKTERRDLD